MVRHRTFMSFIVKQWPGEGVEPRITLKDIQKVEQELEEVEPRLIIALGAEAARFFMDDPDLDMDLVNGIPHRVDGRVIIPCFHPAVALSNDSLALKLWLGIKAAAEYVADADPDRIWSPNPRTVHVTRVRLREPEIITRSAAIDTEGTPGHPFSIQYSRNPDEAVVVSAEDAKWLDFRGQCIFHNAKYDVRMCREMGVKLPPAALWEDTMVMAYCRQDLPHGLKALSYRLLRRHMTSFEETVRRHFNPVALDYLETVALVKGWTRPAEMLVEDKTTGRLKTYRPNATDARAKSILNTYAKDPNADINDLWFNVTKEQREEVEGVLGPFPRFGIEAVPRREADQYGGTDAAATWEIHAVISSSISKSALYRQDVSCLPALVEIESTGLPFSSTAAHELSARFQSEAEAVRDEMREISGYETLNPGSVKQISQILFKDWGIKSPRKTKLTGNDSSDDRALSTLALQFAERRGVEKTRRFIYLLQEYRELKKMDGTYARALPPRVKAGRVHPRINNTQVVSGRLSSSDPNLQNIPSRSERGRLIRGCFIAPEGSMLLSVDYSQIELRILAHESGDPALIEAFTGSEDLHRKTEKYIFGVPDEEAGKKRTAAKCFHPDTEVLTRARGWRKIVDITTDEVIAQFHPDDRSITWTQPTEVFTMKHPSKKLIHFKAEGIDLRVTPDHRMLSYSRTGSYDVTLAQNFCDRERLVLNAGTLEDTTGPSSRRHLLQLVVAVQADGSFTNNQITLGFTRKRKIARMEGILQAFGMPDAWVHRVNQWKAGEVHTFVLRPRLASKVKPFLTADKAFQWDMVRNLTHAERIIVLNELAHWDGHQDRNAFRYFSTVRQNVEVAQALAAITGRKTRLVTNAKGMHILTIRASNQTYTSLKMKKEIHYDSEVACLSVPSTFVLVRDGGIPVICGQTFNFRIAYAGPNGSPKGLQEQLFLDGITLSVQACADYRDRWFAMYPDVARFLRNAGDEARRNGYAETSGGRRRYLPFARLSDVPRVRAESERQAGNLKIQGAAQEVIKAAMVRWDQKGRAGANAIVPTKLCMQIHDELLFEVGTVDPIRLKRVSRYLVDLMLEDTAHFKVPILAEAKAGRDWGSQEKVKLT